MNFRSTIIFTMLCAVILIAAQQTETGDIEKAGWLIGTWENKTSRGIMYESWKRDGDQALSGMSYAVNNGDTVVFETIRLVQEEAGLFYIPVVRNQNDGQPVRFAASSVTDSAMVFENPQHDFPHMISYTRINADSLVAEISGTINGQERRQRFPMRRAE